ncbi:MAG: glycosyltransferase [Methanomassiliicoccales archaeon]|nr:glycosyltransferase [Methanomassiliicoccales archaeon]
MAGQTRVSVVVPFYGKDVFLKGCIENILQQTLRDLEVVVVSEPDAAPELTAFLDEHPDPRIRHLPNPTRLGLERSLNRVMPECHGEYLARQDSDDLSAPRRLERQVAYLDSHKDIDILGTWSHMVSADLTLIGPNRPPVGPGFVRWFSLFEDPIINSSSMMRRGVFQKAGGYDPEMSSAEDYAFWTEALKTCTMDNLPEVLCYQRRNPAGVSLTNPGRQTELAHLISRRSMEEVLGHELTEGVAWAMRRPYLMAGLEDCIEGERQLLRLRDSFLEGRPASPDDVRKIRDDLHSRIWRLSMRGFGISPWRGTSAVARALLRSPPRLRPKDLKQWASLSSVSFREGRRTKGGAP